MKLKLLKDYLFLSALIYCYWDICQAVWKQPWKVKIKTFSVRLQNKTNRKTVHRSPAFPQGMAGRTPPTPAVSGTVLSGTISVQNSAYHGRCPFTLLLSQWTLITANQPSWACCYWRTCHHSLLALSKQRRQNGDKFRVPFVIIFRKQARHWSQNQVVWLMSGESRYNTD